MSDLIKAGAVKPLPRTKWTCWHIDAAGALFCIAVSALAYFLALRPLIRQHAAFAKQDDQLAVQQEEAAKLAAMSAPLGEQLASAQKALAASGMTLRPAQQVNRRVAELTELVNKCGLKVNDIQLGSIFRATRYDIIPITLAGCGKHKDCAALLHGLSELFPDMGVASFELSGNPQRPNEPGQFHLDLFWYAARQADPDAQTGGRLPVRARLSGRTSPSRK